MEKNKFPLKFRGIKEIILYEVIVAEGKGDNEDPIREVHYFCDENGKIKFVEDPSKNE